MRKSTKYEPSQDQRIFVASCIQAGMTPATVAKVLEIDPRTLKKAYEKEIRTADATLVALGVSCLRDAMQSDDLSAAVNAAKFVMARKAKWTEDTTTQEIKVTTDVDNDIVSRFVERVNADKQDKDDTMVT